MKWLWVVSKIVLGIVKGQPYDRFYKSMKDYGKSPIHQLLKISSLELDLVYLKRISSYIWFGWEMENFHCWKFNLFSFGQLSKLQVFGKLD
jgi:hypothetical protein